MHNSEDETSPGFQRLEPEEEKIIATLVAVFQGIDPQEARKRSGFSKLVSRITQDGWTNGHLEHYQIKASAFEKLCAKFGEDIRRIAFPGLNFG